MPECRRYEPAIKEIWLDDLIQPPRVMKDLSRRRRRAPYAGVHALVFQNMPNNSYGTMGLGFPPRKSNGASAISVMPPINPHLAIVGKVGTAAAPAAALQSRADAPAPAAAAAPWPTVLAPLGDVHTSSDPPLAGSICPAVPPVVLIRPAVPANVRKMAQP